MFKTTELWLFTNKKSHSEFLQAYLYVNVKYRIEKFTEISN